MTGPRVDVAVQILSVDWTDPRALTLRQAMDDEIMPRYADRFGSPSAADAAVRDTAFAIDPATMVVTLLATVDGVPVAHAALRRLGDEYELKRVVTLAGYRGCGISKALIHTIESAAAERGARRLILQTGDRQGEAVRLYEHLGYTPIPVYPPYTAYGWSQCFERILP